MPDTNDIKCFCHNRAMAKRIFTSKPGNSDCYFIASSGRSFVLLLAQIGQFRRQRWGKRGRSQVLLPPKSKSERQTLRSSSLLPLTRQTTRKKWRTFPPPPLSDLTNGRQIAQHFFVCCSFFFFYFFFASGKLLPFHPPSLPLPLSCPPPFRP